MVYSLNASARFMPIHAMTCSTIASGLHDINLLTRSLEWLCGKKDIFDYEKTTSFYGSPMVLIKTKLSRSQSRMALSRLGGEILNSLIKNIDSKLDEENRLHFRISQFELIKGKIVLSNDKENSVKIIAKIEVYPGDKPAEILLKLLTDSLERSKRRGWLTDPPEFSI